MINSLKLAKLDEKLNIYNHCTIKQNFIYFSDTTSNMAEYRPQMQTYMKLLGLQIYTIKS